jgi:hypothetical protein
MRTFSLPPFIPLAATTVIRFGFEGRAQSTLGRSLALLLLRELGHGFHPSLHRVLVHDREIHAGVVGPCADCPGAG